MPKISLIVPVYQAELFLERLLDSILKQTFKDFEVLLVDDGSSDRSGQICDKYAELDNRVQVFHKVNGGVASARQMGLEKARGEYVIHADADDWLELSMLQDLMAVAESSNADMVICDFYEICNNSKQHSHQKPSGISSNEVAADLLSGKLYGALWNKLVKTSEQRSIGFTGSMTMFEDLYINLLFLLKRERRIEYLAKPLYNYDRDINKGSITKLFNLSAWKNQGLLLKNINIYTNTPTLRNAFCDNYTSWAYNALKYNLLSARDYKLCFVKNIDVILRSRYKIRSKILIILSAMGLKSLAFKIYTLVHKGSPFVIQ